MTRLECPLEIRTAIAADHEQILELWEALGYVVDDAVSMGRRLIHDN